MIAAKRDSVAFCDLDSTGLAAWIEAKDIIRPDAVALDADVIAVASDTELAIVVNVAVAHATAGPDADTVAAVQARLAVFNGPPGAFDGMDRTLLCGTRKLLDYDVTDQPVGCCAFDSK